MGRIMKEHELSKFGKIASILIFVIPAIISAIVNIARHNVPNPMAFFIVIIGFALFLIAKISMIRKKRLVSFGTSNIPEGGVGKPFDVSKRASRAIGVNPINSGLQYLSQIGDGVCVISASDDKQLSQESKDWGGGHGVFTYFLLKGLEGDADYNKDSRVTLGELIPYLSEEVRRATKNAQSPTVAGRFDPALSIGK